MGRWPKVVGLLALAGGWLPFVTPQPAQAADPAPITHTFLATGAEQTFAVPPGVRTVHVIVTGGHGGASDSAPGGKGGVVTGDIPTAPGTNLYVEVGGNGAGANAYSPAAFNGGGQGGGGGASDIRTSKLCVPNCEASLASRVVIAGGGGGGGSGGYGTAPFAGGKGGDVAAPGLDGNGSEAFATPGGKGGTEATASAPGSGGAAGDTGVAGVDGDLGAGGDGAAGGRIRNGGGGGGGLYGGGGGASSNAYLSDPNTFGGFTGAGGGGGGSSFITPLAGTPVFAVDETGVPSVVITYNLVPTTLTATPVLVKLSPLGIFIGKISATLRRADNGDPIPGQTIAFASGTKGLCTAVTDASGTATCSGLNFTISTLLTLGYQAHYAGGGSTAYLPSNADAAILM